MFIFWLQRTYLPLQNHLKSSVFVISIHLINYILFKITARTDFMEPNAGPENSNVLQIFTFETNAKILS